MRKRAVVAAVLVAVFASGCSVTIPPAVTVAYWRTMPARFRLYRRCMARQEAKRAARAEGEK